ncbi:hypothetical protein [Halocynthiibacter styelae]|uniref:Uncharacterized protein n=1 Tax=Halocynthiibacter styelae TaxID=2761955 RepID=A0A8J7ICK2_9RHOB|nr:hypothetical protein [Paenihalocynthiibacter styelae]MBI1492869.1 hypothetical protein [Paenihalocynthiibacter styelae]
MSRWNDGFLAHPIHETLRICHEWTLREFDEVDSATVSEQRRLIRVLDLIRTALDGLDSEVWPTALVTNLEHHMRHAQFYKQLEAYHADGKADHLKVANNHIDGQLPEIYQLVSLSRSREELNIMEGAESAFERFVKTVEKKSDEVAKEMLTNAQQLVDLEQNSKRVALDFDELQLNTSSKLNEWSSQFSAAQNERATNYSDLQIKWNEEASSLFKSLDDAGKQEQQQRAKMYDLDLSRFDAAPLIAFTATKETDYGTETDGRIPPRCGAYRADQWANA